MIRYNDASAIRMFESRMASSLSDSLKANPMQRTDKFPAS